MSGLWNVIGAVIGAAVIGWIAAYFCHYRYTKRRAWWTVVLTTAVLNIAANFASVPKLPGGITKMAWWVIIGVPVYFLVARFIRPPAPAKARPPAIGEGIHGSAYIGAADEMMRKGHLYAPGVSAAPALGRVNAGPALDPRFRFIGHILTCAPTGAGKGIGAVIPALLEYPGSMVVLDIKGENYAVTARHRRAMGHAVHVLDPFGVTGAQASGINWLDRIDPADPDCVSEAAALASMLIVPDPKSESHWDELAANLLQGVMIHVAATAEPARRNITELRRLLTGPEDELLSLLAEMSLSDDGFGVVARAANSFIAKADKERSGVLSTAIKNTAFLDDPRIAAALSHSDFDMADLKRKPMTVYVVMPPARIAAQGRFMRGVIGQVLASITATERKPAAPVLLLLDEFAQLGRMQAVEDAISLVRGYGAFFWLIVQDLSQLKGVYPRWQTFLANSAKQFFGTADYDTARYISESVGQSTVQFTTAGSSVNTSYSPQGGGSSGSSTSQQFTGRAVLTPDEVMRLGPQQPIVLLSGEPAYVLRRINYLHDAEYAGLFDANPYHA